MQNSTEWNVKLFHILVSHGTDQSLGSCFGKDGVRFRDDTEVLKGSPAFVHRQADGQSLHLGWSSFSLKGDIVLSVL